MFETFLPENVYLTNVCKVAELAENFFHYNLSLGAGSCKPLPWKLHPQQLWSKTEGNVRVIWGQIGLGHFGTCLFLLSLVSFYPLCVSSLNSKDFAGILPPLSCSPASWSSPLLSSAFSPHPQTWEQTIHLLLRLSWLQSPGTLF